jgi:membrane associated rhomboid family serine protease
VKYLLIANLVVYVLELLPVVSNWVISLGVLVPSFAYGHLQLWRFVSYMFLHDATLPFHLLFNMLALWMFGIELERRWGAAQFLVFYFLGGIGAGMLSFFAWHSHIMGASGAILALLTAYAFYFPHRQLLLFFILPVSARTAVIIFGIISFVFALRSSGDGVAHITHLGGIVVAIIYLKLAPAVQRAWQARTQAWEERIQRQQAEQGRREERYFEDEIDPILKKIAEQGMGALTKEERRKLDEASQKQRERMARQKVVPFDVFKKKKK